MSHARNVPQRLYYFYKENLAKISPILITEKNFGKDTKHRRHRSRRSQQNYDG